LDPEEVVTMSRATYALRLTMKRTRSYNCDLNILQRDVAEAHHAQTYVSTKEEKAEEDSRLPCPDAHPRWSQSAQGAAPERPEELDGLICRRPTGPWQQRGHG
jgi:hypothetical protein